MDAIGLSLKKVPGVKVEEMFHEPILTPGIRSVIGILSGTGGTEEALLAVMEAAGDDELPAMYYLLERLEQEGLLCRFVAEEGRPIATLEPMTRKFRFSSPSIPADKPLRLSRFACIRRDGLTLILENGLSRARIRLHDSRAVSIVAALVEAKTLAELLEEAAGILSPQSLLGFAVLLAAAGALAEGEEEDAVLRQWEFHDLLFHTSTRGGRHDRPSGGTQRFPGEIKPLPAVKEVRGEVVPLPYVTVGGGRDFFEVLEARRSIRSQGAEVLTLQQLSDFLGHTARITKVVPADRHAGRPYDIVFRPYPSGGGCSELEIYPAVNACDGLPRGLYRYDGSCHRLEVVSAPTPLFERLLQEAALSYGGSPQILLVIAARFQRVAWKYESIAYSLILKNVGCLQQTMYLVATALGLAPCALGLGDAELFADVAGVDYLREGSVGEFVFGAPG